MTNPADDTGPARPTPDDLGPAGARLWRAVFDRFDMEDHEAEVLRQACTTADAITALDAVVAVEGVMGETSQGPRAHPALVEARQQRLALARLIASLRLPADTGEPAYDGDAGDDTGRAQARAGFRGVYSIAGGA